LFISDKLLTIGAIPTVAENACCQEFPMRPLFGSPIVLYSLLNLHVNERLFTAIVYQADKHLCLGPISLYLYCLGMPQKARIDAWFLYICIYLVMPNKARINAGLPYICIYLGMPDNWQKLMPGSFIVLSSRGQYCQIKSFKQ
jgi:hypothetical protein